MASNFSLSKLNVKLWMLTFAMLTNPKYLLTVDLGKPYLKNLNTLVHDKTQSETAGFYFLNNKSAKVLTGTRKGNNNNMHCNGKVIIHNLYKKICMITY